MVKNIPGNGNSRPKGPVGYVVGEWPKQVGFRVTTAQDKGRERWRRDQRGCYRPSRREHRKVLSSRRDTL